MVNIIYWIHEQHHTNPYNEGYVGVTNNLVRRLSGHKKHNENPIIKNKFHKSIVSILHEDLSESDAYMLEEKYRPVPNVGWNINKGGYKPPSRSGIKLMDTKHTLIGEQRTEKQKQAAIEHGKRMKQRALDGLNHLPPGQKGYKRSELSKQRYRAAASKRPNVVCPHCGISGKGPALKRWHFDRCKHKV